MRHAVISNNTVVNVVEISKEDNSFSGDDFIFVKSLSADIGDTWNGKKFIPKLVPLIEKSDSEVHKLKDSLRDEAYRQVLPLLLKALYAIWNDNPSAEFHKQNFVDTMTKINLEYSGVDNEF